MTAKFYRDRLKILTAMQPGPVRRQKKKCKQTQFAPAFGKSRNFEVTARLSFAVCSRTLDQQFSISRGVE